MDNEVKIQFKNSITGEKKLEKYKETLSQISSVLNGLNTGAAKELENSSVSTKEIATDVKNIKNITGAAFNYTTLRAFSRGLKNIVQSMGSFVNKSSTYYENLNLLQVAFRGDTTEAEKFVNKLSEMYGLDESWGYRTVGLFKQLANAMGLSDQVGTKLSRTLTQLAIDTSSLYNFEDPNEAVSILTSALAGQTKPARRLGADITQSTLQQTLDKAGIDKSITDLTYAEKRLVIIASLLSQVKESTNDWGKTIESPANQTRILSEQWERLTRAVGNIFLPIVYKALPYLNAMLMVLTEIAKAIGNFIAGLLGFDPKELNFGAGVSSEFNEMNDEIDKTTNSTEKLKKSMLGLRSFDKIINISTPSSAGKSGSGSGLGVDNDILKMANKAMDEYNKKIENTKMKATEIRDKVMEWLGFTKEIDEKTGEVSFKFDHITSGTVLGALAIGGSIFTGVMRIYKILSKFGILKFPNLTGLTKVFSGTSITTTLTTVAKFLPIILLVAAEIQAILTDKNVQKQIKNLQKNFKELIDTLKPLIDKILPPLKKLLSEIGKSLSREWDKLVHLLGTVTEMFLSSLNTTIRIFIDIVNGDFKKALDDIIEWVKTMISSVGDLLGDIFKPIKELGHKFDVWKQGLREKMIEKFKQTDFGEIGKTILTSILNGLLGGIPQTVKKFYDDFKKELDKGGENVTVKVGKKAGLSGLGIIGTIFKKDGGIYSGGQWHNIERYDSGGTPTTGQLFWARENGLPEMVGQIGGHTAVMNNDQIVGSVASGVYRATLAANSQTQSNGNSVINIYLDKNKKLATYTLNELQSMAKSNGKPIEIG